MMTIMLSHPVPEDFKNDYERLMLIHTYLVGKTHQCYMMEHLETNTPEYIEWLDTQLNFCNSVESKLTDVLGTNAWIEQVTRRLFHVKNMLKSGYDISGIPDMVMVGKNGIYSELAQTIENVKAMLNHTKYYATRAVQMD